MTCDEILTMWAAEKTITADYAERIAVCRESLNDLYNTLSAQRFDKPKISRTYKPTSLDSAVIRAEENREKLVELLADAENHLHTVMYFAQMVSNALNGKAHEWEINLFRDYALVPSMPGWETMALTYHTSASTARRVCQRLRGIVIDALKTNGIQIEEE